MSDGPLSPRTHDEVTKRREAESERDQLKAENTRYLKAIKELRTSNASLQKQLKDLSSSVEEALSKKQSGGGGSSGGGGGAATDAEISKRDGIIKSLQRQLFVTRKHEKELEGKLETYQQSGYIADLQSQLKLKTKQCEELTAERKTLEKLQRQKDKALVRLESDRDIGPAAVRRFEEDIRALKHQLKEHQEAKLEYERVIAQKQQMLDRHFRLFGAVHDELLKKSKLNKDLDEDDANSVVKTFLSYDRDISRISEMIESKDNIIVEKTRIIETLEKNYSILEKARETDQRLRIQEASRMMRALEDDSRDLQEREEEFTEREKELRYAVATLKSRNRQLEAAIQQLTTIDASSPRKQAPVNLSALAAGRIDDLPIPSPRRSTPRRRDSPASTGSRRSPASSRKQRGESLHDQLSRTPAAKNPTRIPMLRGRSPNPIIQSPDDGSEVHENGVVVVYSDDEATDVIDADTGAGSPRQPSPRQPSPQSQQDPSYHEDDGDVSGDDGDQGSTIVYDDHDYAVDEPDDYSAGVPGTHARNVQNAGVAVHVNSQPVYQQAPAAPAPVPAAQPVQPPPPRVARNPAVQRAGSAGQHARSHSYAAPQQYLQPAPQQPRRASTSHQTGQRAPSPVFGAQGGYEPHSAPRQQGYGQPAQYGQPGVYGGGYPMYGQGGQAPPQAMHRSSSAGAPPVWQQQPYSAGRRSVGRR